MNHATILIIVGSIAGAVAIAAVPALLKRFRHVFCVPEGWTALVYHHGLYVRRSNAGRHVIWGSGWTISLIDLRKTSLLTPVEEFILADHLCLRISTHVSYHVTDPAKAAHATQYWPNELYHIALRALHKVLGNFSSSELLHERPKIGAQILNLAQPEAGNIGICLLAIDLRCGIFPAEFDRPFAAVRDGSSAFVLGVPGGFVPLKQQTKNVAPEGHEAK
jgi:regulator of protease activity HflC (stomatin/prohibitin superfamily)